MMLDFLFLISIFLYAGKPSILFSTHNFLDVSS